MRMVKSHRVLFRRQVVAQDQIQFVLAVPHPCDGRDGVVRLAVGFGKDHGFGVRILAPLRENPACQLTELVFVFRVQPQHRHRILHDTAVHIFKTGHFKAELFFCFLHWERVVATLEMLMCQNAAADDGKVGIRAEEIVRELLDE